MRVLSRFLFLVFALGRAIPAQADLLFLTFNPAPGEIRAAREAAEARGEKLFVLPEVPAKLLQRMSSLDEEEATLIRRSEKTESTEAIDAITARMLEIQEEKEKLLQSVTLTPATLTETLKRYEAANVRLSSLILSGHDGNGKFWGAIGKELTSEDLRRAFAAVPRLREGVRSLLLLGCYTTNIGSLDTHWKAVLPNARAFAGYEKKGPLASVPAGHRYLKSFLLREEKFGRAKTKQEMLSLFQGLPQIQDLAAAVATADFYVDNRGARTIAELYGDCRSLGADSPLREKFRCHYEARPGCEDAPSDTKAGVLRKFYEDLQANAHCKDMLSVDADHSLPHPEAVLRLIFFKNIKDNFFRLHRSELGELDDWLRDSGFEPLNLADKPRSRANLLRDVRQARTSLMQWGRGRGTKATQKAGSLAHFKAAQRLSEIDRALLQLVPACTPSAWVDPLVPGHSPCLTPTRTLESAAEKSWLKESEASP